VAKLSPVISNHVNRKIGNVSQSKAIAWSLFVVAIKHFVMNGGAFSYHPLFVIVLVLVVPVFCCCIARERERK